MTRTTTGPQGVLMDDHNHASCHHATLMTSRTTTGPQGVLVDEATATAAAENHTFVPETHDLKGMGDTITHRPSEKEKKVDAGPDLSKKKKNKYLDDLYYGRFGELQRVRRILHDLKEQRGGAMVLTGGRGCGKTLLVKQLEMNVRGSF
jgi:hypothetical protein